MTSLLFLGFMLGIRHALEADHIATVASLASNRPSRNQMLSQGLAWGLGHSATIIVLAGTVMWMDALIPAVVATSLETAVGITMVLLGIDVIRRAAKTNVHAHVHRHDDGRKHWHTHSHTSAEWANHDAPTAHSHSHQNHSTVRALLMGLLHGLAGSAALLLVMVGEIDSPLLGLVYLLLFSAGSIAGMAIFSIVISVPLVWSGRKLPNLQKGLQLGIGAMTSVLGATIAFAGLA